MCLHWCSALLVVFWFSGRGAIIGLLVLCLGSIAVELLGRVVGCWCGLGGFGVGVIWVGLVLHWFWFLLFSSQLFGG